MPLTAADRIVLVRVKIHRARKHLQDLAADLLLAEKAPVPVVVGEHVGFRQGAPDNFVFLPKLPFDALATAGDIVHNLRSSLDHLANQLVLVGGGIPDSNTCFPIAKDFATYEADKGRRVKGMRPVAVQAIDDVKPYKGGNDVLWRIHELDIIDKHRNLFAVAHDYLFFGDGFEGDYWLKAEVPHFAGVFDVQAETDVQLEIDAAVGQSQSAKSNSLLPILHEMVDFAEELVLNFKPLLE